MLSRKLAVVEYDGQAPSSTSSHGNAKRRRQYKRTAEHVLEELRSKVANNPPIDVYNEYVDADLDDAPWDLQQIRHLKYREKKKQKQDIISHSSSVADHVMETASMINDHEFVQAMIHAKGKPSTVVLYMPDQIQHMLICASQTTVIGVDRTFNLGAFYVTTTVYKC